MTTTYQTRAGETVDLACLQTYGRTRDVTEAALAANPGLAGLGPVLPVGTVIVMPDLAEDTPQRYLVSLWD